MDPASRPIDDEATPPGTTSSGGRDAASARLEAMRRRLGDLRAAEPQWKFGSAMNDMLGADTGPIRPAAAPEPMVEQEREDRVDAVDAEPDPLASVPEPEEAMRLVEDQARRLRELAAESVDFEDRPGPELDQSRGAGAADEEAAPSIVVPSMQFVTDAEQRDEEHAEAQGVADAEVGEERSEPGDPAVDPAVVEDSGFDGDRPIAMPSMEFVTDADERFQEFAAADRPGPPEDLPADELAAALESMLKIPGSPDSDPAGDEKPGGAVAGGHDEPAATLDRTLERMIDEGHRADLDPAFEPPSDVDDVGEDGDEAGRETADPTAAMPLAMEFVVHAEDLLLEDPEDLDSGAGDLPTPAAPPASRRAALKAVRGAMAAKAAMLAPVRKALGDDGWGDVDESSLSPAQLTSLMVNLDQTLADGVETLLESSYDAVADILDLVFEEVAESDVAGESDELLEEAETETWPS